MALDILQVVTALSVSTMADHVGACAATLMPLYALRADQGARLHGRARAHGHDTTLPVPVKVKTGTGRIWTYIRDGDRGRAEFCKANL